MLIGSAFSKSALRVSTAAAALLMLVSCAEPYGPNQTVGGLVGAGAGALVGNQFGHGSGRTAATVGGAVVGGALGSAVGRDVDYRNRYGYYGAPAYSAPPPPAYYAPPPPAYYAPPPAYYYPPPAYYGPSYGSSMSFNYHGHR